MWPEQVGESIRSFLGEARELKEPLEGRGEEEQVCIDPAVERYIHKPASRGLWSILVLQV